MSKIQATIERTDTTEYTIYWDGDELDTTTIDTPPNATPDIPGDFADVLIRNLTGGGQSPFERLYRIALGGVEWEYVDAR